MCRILPRVLFVHGSLFRESFVCRMLSVQGFQGYLCQCVSVLVCKVLLCAAARFFVCKVLLCASASFLYVRRTLYMGHVCVQSTL